MSDPLSRPPLWRRGKMIELARGLYGREIVDDRGDPVAVCRAWHTPLLLVAPRALAALTDCVKWMEEQAGETEMAYHDTDGHDAADCVLCTARQVIADAATPPPPPIQLEEEQG